ncbi:tetratricopeptide repeat protein [uncultured Psychroserpens sp.]|uniref:tetratricopeptide repeat protein n=1 Tax=uncultured Psychroserpens sp. TaxID=255436 RepID=UPI002608BB01|nr:tetratricopeptide repeat protein [uncultured Psychroserpens sp.]
MKLIVSLFILISSIGFSQSDTTELQFETKYFNAVDKWVAFPKKEVDTSYTFGFIYIDEQAGFTFDYHSNFINTENGLKIIPRTFEAGLKSRLSPNTMDVAVLTDKQVSELELETEPDWLAIYKRNSEETEYLKNIGFHYNAVGASNLALEPLKKAYSQDPHFIGLEFELAYAYNALGKYNEAIEVLDKAIENDPEIFWFYRELGFSYKNIGQIEKAETIYKQGIKLTDDNAQKAEMAINMAQAYYLQKNKEKFDEWAKLTRKFTDESSIFNQYIDTWEEKLNNE